MDDKNYLKKELYELLKTDENIFDFIQESSLDGLWYWDLENPEEEWMNPKFWTVLGYNPDKMPHKSTAWQHIINQDDLKTATENFTRHCENPDHPYDQIVRYTHKNGSTVWIRCRGIAIRDESGKPVRMLGAHNDITAIKKQGEKLKESVSMFKVFFEHSQGMLCTHNRHGILLSINKAAASSLGCNTDELIGKNLHDLLHPKEKPFFKRYLQLVFEKKVHKGEMTILHKNGQTRTWAYQNSVIEQPYGEEIVIGSAIDITEKKESEIELKNSKERLEKAQERSQIGYWEVNTDTGDLFWTDVIYDIFGVDKETFQPTQDAFYAMLHPDDIQQVNEAAEKSRTTGIFDVIHSIIRPDGEIRHVHEMADAKVDNDENVLILSGTLQDITTISRQNLKLQQQQDDLNAIVKSLDDIVFVVDKNFVFKRVWTQDKSILLYKKEEIIGKTIFDILPAELSEKMKPAILSTLESRETATLNDSLPSGPQGQQRHYTATIRFLETERKATPSVTILIKNVTKKTLQERELVYRQKLNSTMAEISQDLLNTENVYNTLEDVLKKVSLAMGAERCFYFEMEHHGDQTYCNHILEYVTPEDIFIRNKEGFMGAPCSVLDVAKTDVTGGEVFQMKTSDIPENSPFKEIQEAQGIQSFIFVPMTNKGKVKGSIGLDSVKTERVWSEHEAGFLQSVAISMALALERQESYQQLRESETSLKEAHFVAQLGRWELHLDTNQLHWSDSVFNIFETDPEIFPATYESFLEIVHPDDRDMVNKAYTHSLKTKKPYDIEHRLRMKDGRIKWLKEKCHTEYNPDGKPVRSVGIVQDITDLKNAELKLKELYEDTRRMNRLMAGREDRILELKKEVNRLSKQLDKGAVYNSAEDTYE
jgi:PAS domain S-box-containing protein